MSFCVFNFPAGRLAVWQVTESDKASESVCVSERMRSPDIEFGGKSETSESKVLRSETFVSISDHLPLKD
ncbi:hypothetical protein HanRHA438_Chr04g0156821 [Helianthus annuus]|nr:hypothetical protein HanIR_Chr04g0157981 [Helianthus annuus]KAJ0925193.1 hypothetical protein HanRHA438_Chr04g0156821 [Helianthus annuus]